jgi:hypothetical protein
VTNKIVFVSWAEIEDPTLKAYSSTFVLNLVYISVSENSPLPRLSSRLTGVAYQEADLSSTIITQVHLVLGTKGHCKMCRFVTTQMCQVLRECGNWHKQATVSQ